MKKILILWILLPLWATAQIPVTDVAANANLVVANTTLGTANANLVAINTSLGSINSQLGTMNSTLNQLVALLKKNVKATSTTSKLTTQDIKSKRKSPSYLYTSPEMTELKDLKEKILGAYRETKSNLKTFEHLESSEISEMTDLLADVVGKVSTYVSQASKVASSAELIEPGLRLSTIGGIVDNMHLLLDEVQLMNAELKQKNVYRKSINGLIETN